jgi:hypothetical protein
VSHELFAHRRVDEGGIRCANTGRAFGKHDASFRELRWPSRETERATLGRDAARA